MQPVKPMPESQTPKAARPLRVLVVEDFLDTADTVAAMLKQWGHDCRVCTSGNEALALAPYYQPNIVLIDIGLPDINGWELARRLPGGPLLIAITARGEDADFVRSQEVGIRYHLVKPAFQRQLRDLLARLANDKRS